MANLKSEGERKGVTFHDANIAGVSISIAQQAGDVYVLAYEDASSRHRQPTSFQLRDIGALMLRFDLDELAYNATAGNVQDGRFGAADAALRMSLVGGYLEMVAGAVVMQRPAGLAELAFTQKNLLGADLFREGQDEELDLSFLDRIELSVSGRLCRLDMRLQTGTSVFEHRPATLWLADVTSCLVMTNVAGMGGLNRIGNVLSVRINREKSVIWMHLKEGLIEVVCGSALIVRDWQCSAPGTHGK